MKTFSLRRRLTALLILSLTGVWLAMLAVSYGQAVQEAGELADARLEDGARALALLDTARLGTLAHAPASEAMEDDGDGDDDAAVHIAFQVFDAQGHLMARTTDAPNVPFNPDRSSETVRSEGISWRSIAHWGPQHTFQLRVFEKLQARDEAVASVARRMLMPLIVGLPILAVMVWILVGRGLRSMEELSHDISSRSADKLDAIVPRRLPSEVAPLVASLNALLARLSGSLEKERRFTADAAHELRTPLAAIKVQAQVAAASPDSAQRQFAISQIVEGVNRTTHLMEQLLLLARLDHGSFPERIGPVDVGAHAASCASRYADAAMARQLDLSVSVPVPCRVRSSPAMLDALMGNLIDNAVRYVQPGGHIVLSVIAQVRGVVLSVKDDGPGIPEELRSRILDRFYRVGGDAVPGSGLGLSIVDRIARCHGGEVVIGVGLEGRGFGVSVTLPDVAEGREAGAEAAMPSQGHTAT